MIKALKTLAHREEPLGSCWVGLVQLVFGLGWHLSGELRDERSCLQQAQQAGAESSRQGSSCERPWERGTGTSWGRERTPGMEAGRGGGAGRKDPVGPRGAGAVRRFPESCAEPLKKVKHGTAVLLSGLRKAPDGLEADRACWWVSALRCPVPAPAVGIARCFSARRGLTWLSADRARCCHPRRCRRLSLW